MAIDMKYFDLEFLKQVFERFEALHFSLIPSSSPTYSYTNKMTLSKSFTTFEVHWEHLEHWDF